MSEFENYADSDLLIISSADRLGGSPSSSDFLVDLGSSQELSRVRKVALVSVTGVNGTYNIYEGSNDFKFNYNTVDYTATITVGEYNTTQLISALTTEINTLINPATVVITQDPITQKLTFTFSAALAIIYNEDDGNNMASETGILTTTAVATDVIVADRIIRLNGLSRMYLRSSKLANANSINSRQKTDDILCCIPLGDVGFGQVINHRPLTEREGALTIQNPIDLRNILDIKMTDYEGIPINLNGFNLEILIRVFYSTI